MSPTPFNCSAPQLFSSLLPSLLSSQMSAKTSNKTPPKQLPEKIYYVEHGKCAPYEVLNPEYAIIQNALERGYSWYDLICDSQLLEPTHTLKVVYVSKEELAVRQKEQAAQEAARRERETQEMRARAFGAEVDAAVRRILMVARNMEPEERTMDALVDMVIARVNEYPVEHQQPILERVCPLIESKNLITFSEEEQCERAVRSILAQVRTLSELQRETDQLAVFIADAVEPYNPELHTKIVEMLVPQIEAEGLRRDNATVVPPSAPAAPAGLLVSRRIVTVPAATSRFSGWFSAPATPTIAAAIPVTAPATPEQVQLPLSPQSTASFVTADVDNEDMSSFVTATPDEDDDGNAWGIPRLDLSPPATTAAAVAAEETRATLLEVQEATATEAVTEVTEVMEPEVVVETVAESAAPADEETRATLLEVQESTVAEEPSTVQAFLARVKQVAAAAAAPQSQPARMSREVARRNGRIRKAVRDAAAAVAAAAAAAPAPTPAPTTPITMHPLPLPSIPALQTNCALPSMKALRNSELIAPRSRNGAWYYIEPSGIRRGPLTQSQMVDWLLAVYWGEGSP